jgi:hypothetical protein
MGHIYTDVLDDGFDKTLDNQRESMFGSVNKAIFDYNQALAGLLIGHNKKLHAGEKINIAELDAETRENINQLRKNTIRELVHAASSFLNTMDTIA